MLLAGVGKILEIDIPKMPNGNIKGYALIYMDKVKDVPAAIEVLNNLKFENSTLRASNKLTDTAQEIYVQRTEATAENYVKTHK